MQRLAPPCLLAHDAQRTPRRRRDRRRQRGRVDVAARALDQELDDVLVTGDEGAEAAERLAEGADQHRHIARGEPEMLAATAAGGPHHADAVRVVDHEPGVVRAGRCGERRQRREVAVHAEHAVRDDERAAALGRRSGRVDIEQRARCGCVRMWIPQVARAAHEARRVDERGVVELVGEQQVALVGERGEHAEVRHVAGGEDHRACTTGELGELPLQRLMFGAVPADEVRSAGTRPVPLRRLGHRRGDGGVAGETEVIVAAEVDAAVLRGRPAPAQVPIVDVAQRGGAGLRRAAHRALRRRCACRAA